MRTISKWLKHLKVRDSDEGYTGTSDRSEALNTLEIASTGSFKGKEVASANVFARSLPAALSDFPRRSDTVSTNENGGAGNISSKSSASSRNSARSVRQVQQDIDHFHQTIQGSVFAGTIAIVDDTPQSRRVVVKDVITQAAKHHSSRNAAECRTFCQYVNHSGGPLDACFSIFMRQVPPAGSRISFFALPLSDTDQYVAVACNLLSVPQI